MNIAVKYDKKRLRGDIMSAKRLIFLGVFALIIGLCFPVRAEDDIGPFSRKMTRTMRAKRSFELGQWTAFVEFVIARGQLEKSSYFILMDPTQSLYYKTYGDLGYRIDRFKQAVRARDNDEKKERALEAAAIIGQVEEAKEKKALRTLDVKAPPLPAHFDFNFFDCDVSVELDAIYQSLKLAFKRKEKLEKFYDDPDMIFDPFYYMVKFYINHILEQEYGEDRNRRLCELGAEFEIRKELNSDLMSRAEDRCADARSFKRIMEEYEMNY